VTLRLLRRLPLHRVSSRFVTRRELVAWAKQGQLLGTDLCARSGHGTLPVAELALLEAPLAVGARARLEQLSIALLMIAAAAALARTHLVGGLVSLGLLAVASARIQQLGRRETTDLDALTVDGGPFDGSTLASPLRQVASVCAVAALALGPGTEGSLVTAGGGLCAILASRRVRRAF
jgi:hypothetical protein